MANDVLSKMTLTRWIIIAAIVAAVVIFSLLQFTSLQIPTSVTQGKQEPQVHQGIIPSGSTQSPTNLDRVYDQIHNQSGIGQSETEPGSTTKGESADE